MRGPFSEYAAPPIYITRIPEKAGIRFSRTELVQLTVAILALSGALTLLNVIQVGFFLDARLLMLIFGAALIAVGTGVGLHEVAHKAVAQRYGHWAEFRYNPMGLALAFFFAFLGFIYGAPGATLISGPVSPEQNGKISAAGPATNVALGAGFLGLATVLGTAATGFDLVFVAAVVAGNVSFMNFILAVFNMLPIMPLDGAKVWAWNKGIYAGLMGIAAVLLVANYVL